MLGYEQTVMPQLENALLAGHDVIFLGERGQAKTRMIRSLTGLLDEWMPIVAGSEINDDPYHPVSRTPATSSPSTATTRRSSGSTATPLRRKLATPDTSIADLIGEVDPIKVAEGRYLSDELTLHYGLMPRTNRGIFAINELPTSRSASRSACSTCSRSATSRSAGTRSGCRSTSCSWRRPTPRTTPTAVASSRRSRIASVQIRLTIRSTSTIELQIMRQEAFAVGGRASVSVPDYLGAVVATISQLARRASRQPAQRCLRAIYRLELRALAANACGADCGR